MARHRPTTAHTLAALGAGLLLLCQVVGLQQLCACGGCAVSRALGIVHSETHFPGDGHPCCAEQGEAATQPGWHAEAEPCGCSDGHARHAPEMVLRSLPDLPDAPIAFHTTPAATEWAAQRTFTAPTTRSHLSRGPPGVDSGPPLYVRQLVLRI